MTTAATAMNRWCLGRVKITFLRDGHRNSLPPLPLQTPQTPQTYQHPQFPQLHHLCQNASRRVSNRLVLLQNSRMTEHSQKQLGGTLLRSVNNNNNNNDNRSVALTHPQLLSPERLVNG